MFPHHLVPNICTNFGKIIKLYECWLPFSIILCKTKNGFECSKHQTLRFPEDFVLTTEEVTLRIMFSLSQYTFVLGDSLLTKLFRFLIP